ncbi:tRNA pseudouridine synthase B [Hyphomicrobium denitrificans 1NES1]|uniref:tRNA pseudouridine synthase B n=1 Tax=Hyphomicrobium denitrificans 1NES1 TaxID=670307 RepID=N0BHS5_9HYPH|nr:tRNA pseudouridine(55) synthase TruB [Hyphomicrobium denitrificans]AGK59986.1 tRNA pseudouridine synthase B [Hyphomicrobium denitrificans 1NES1]
MGRRKKGLPVHGWLVLDKPANMTSTQAVGIIRRVFNAQKAGHSGTLDPLATGILPIALGEATKTVSFAVDGEKAYRFTVRWGTETETDDTEGAVTKTSDQRPDRASIEALLSQFHGEIMQVPPAYSAIKVDGARAYDLARDGETVVLEARPVFIDSLQLVDTPDAATSVFEARCGKGTYVRALARDMGRLLGCYGHVIALRRTQVGPFDEAIAVTMDELMAASDSGDPEQLSRLLQPVEAALADLPELLVSQSDAASLARGQTVLIRGRDAPILSGPAYATSKGRLVALGELAKGALHPTRVFNLG